MPELDQREWGKMKESAITGAMTQDKDQSLKSVEQQTYGRFSPFPITGMGLFIFIAQQQFFAKNSFAKISSL
jgi:hypothetical protein